MIQRHLNWLFLYNVHCTCVVRNIICIGIACFWAFWTQALPNPSKACKTITYNDIKVVYILTMVVNGFIDFELLYIIYKLFGLLVVIFM